MPVFLLAALLLSATTCSSLLAQSSVSVDPAPQAGGSPVPVRTAPDSTNGTGLAASAAAYLPVLDDKYKLRAGDKVSLQILEDRELPRVLTVADSGEVDAPYIGRVSVANRTCKQAAAELKRLLEKEYYYRATVVLALDVANKVLGRVYVWGQVRNQGPIDIGVNENITAGKAILRAGGFADFANKKRVKLIRAPRAGAGDGTNGVPGQTFELNMAQILEDGRTEKDIPLEPDDSIIVPSRLINF